MIDKKTELVSVIVPAFDAMDGLQHCLQALASQSCPSSDFEVLEIDNGRNPGIEELVGAYANMRCVEESTPGSYTARNRGIAAARGNLLAFTDADCVPDRNWIVEGVRAMEESDALGIVGGRIVVDLPAEEDSKLNAAQIYEKYVAFDQQDYVERKRFAATANLITSRELIEAVGAFDERLYSGGDLEFGTRAAAAGFALRYDARVIVRHRSRSNLGELMSKARRIAGGEVSLERIGVRQPTVRDRLNLVIPPAITSWRLLTRKRPEAPMRSRIVAIGVLHLLHAVAFIERVAIALGKSARR